MGTESEPHNSNKGIGALDAAIAKSEALIASESQNINIPGLHEYDKVSKQRIDGTHDEISISGRGVYSLFKINIETRVLEAESFASLDDTREDDDKRIHAERIELLRRKFA